MIKEASKKNVLTLSCYFWNALENSGPGQAIILEALQKTNIYLFERKIINNKLIIF